MKDVRFITCCPSDTYYTWQVHLWLESLKDISKSKKAIILIYEPKNRPYNYKWDKIIKLYPEAQFKFIRESDNENMNKYISIYIPIIRPYMMWKYFKENPLMSEHSFFYCDSDILFTKDFSIDKFLDDDINYLSDTNSYINSDYFDSKEKDVLPEKLEEFKTRDILSEITSLIGINRKTAEKFKLHSGGAQYLLKTTDHAFWFKVMNDCLLIRQYLQKVNRDFFENESKGYQSWCADMWAVLWNLWFKGQETKVIPELDFMWASSNIKELETKTIFHNAGITGEFMNGFDCFYKGKYHRGEDPTLDLDKVLNNEKSKQQGTYYYANKLRELKNKYKLDY